jgi:CheY-specific phosphatase CheX
MSAIDVYAEEQIEVAQQTIFQIADSMLYPVAERWQSQDGNVRSEIHFVNKWKGIFFLECTRDLAVTLSSLMLDVEPSDLTEADIADVIGEILNTIAGNLKCLLPVDTELSIPKTLQMPASVEEDASWFTRCTEQSEIVLEGDLGRVRLSLWHCE